MAGSYVTFSQRPQWLKDEVASLTAAGHVPSFPLRVDNAACAFQSGYSTTSIGSRRRLERLNVTKTDPARASHWISVVSSAPDGWEQIAYYEAHNHSHRGDERTRFLVSRSLPVCNVPCACS